MTLETKIGFSSSAFFTTDYERVRAEMERRGIWETVSTCPLPNRAIGCPERRELFYVQQEPRLAAWARYDRDEDFERAYFNVTFARLAATEHPRGDGLSEAVMPSHGLPNTE